MEWKDPSVERPKETGTYITTVQRQMNGGTHVFNCDLHYDADENKWYKNDPFDDSHSPKEEVTDRVSGWADDLGIYLGVIGR